MGFFKDLPEKERRKGSYEWRSDYTKILRMLNNSKTVKEKHGWQRGSPGFLEAEIIDVKLEPYNNLTVITPSFTITGKTGDFNLSETEELIKFVSKKI